MLAIAGLLALGSIVWLGLRVRRARRRIRLRAQPLAPAHLAILERNVPLYGRMPTDLRRELCGYINVFLDEKRFLGCQGLQVTDEMRVTVAGNACVLLLNRDADYFDGFINILMYPDTYVAPEVEYDGDIVVHSDSARAGESWDAGPIVLSWKDVRRGIENSDDGQNVVLHEFAHKLDEQNGIVDGLPMLREQGDYAEWARVLTRAFDEFVERVERGENEVLDSYAATSAPEFFAVATETFFERGERMRERLPELYAQLRKFYRVDPARWPS